MVQSKFNIPETVVKVNTLFQRDRLPIVGEFIATQAKLMCPVGKYEDGRVGGRLRGSITWTTQDSQSEVESPATDKDKMRKPDKRLTLRVGTNVDYAPYPEFGTAPHFIQPPDPSGVLTFMIHGKRVFAKFVEHPGTQPQPYLRPSVDLYKNEILRLLGGKIIK
jgi:hypothetical protein